MPLAFESLSHGTIAFGFFNIDSDMLLLDRLFFFAPTFCRSLTGIAVAKETRRHRSTWDVYRIDRSEDIGDLMGAIHGIRYTGFLGEVYRRFPFPPQPEAFKQKPEGHETRRDMEALIQKYAQRRPIPFVVEKEGMEAAIGVYRFDRPAFQELVRYVWLGGYPRWRDGIRPPEVLEMKRSIQQNPTGIFEGLDLS